jgi:DNA ligase 1
VVVPGPGPRFVEDSDIQGWFDESPDLGLLDQGIGHRSMDRQHLEDALGFPLHVGFCLKKLMASGQPVMRDRFLASISFFSLAKGLFAPLASMSSDRMAALFHLGLPGPPGTEAREALLQKFLGQQNGLTLDQKIGCILGDPFLGSRGGFQRDSLVRLLLSLELRGRRSIHDRLTQVGDVSTVFAESRPNAKVSPPLTAAEVLTTLQYLPTARRTDQFALLRSLFRRTGKMEAYFLAKLLQRKAGFGFDYQGPLLSRTLAETFGAEEDQVSHAVALTDFFHVSRILGTKGPEGLKEVQLQPLVAIRPALASGTVDQVKAYPTWVERKYDGIRLMLHKSTDTRGSILCAAYTRGRRDWMELVLGLRQTIELLGARSVIVDGELYGLVADHEGVVRPATVYEVYGRLQGEARRPINLKYAAFDIVYLNGHDVTALPLTVRRQHLQALLAPLTGLPLPVPLEMAEGQLAESKDDVNRLYQHFRAQGYEGCITKDLDGAYLLGARDNTWLKKKPEVTLDLVLLAGIFAVTEKTNVGMFGSYVIAAKQTDGTFLDVGDVAGVDRAKDQQIQETIMKEGLITGNRIERTGVSGTRPGIELRPFLVAVIKFEGLLKEPVTGEIKLRGPKLVALRPDKGPQEANTLRDLEELYLRQRMS